MTQASLNKTHYGLASSRRTRIINSAPKYASWGITVGAGQTHEITALGLSADTEMDWGDGVVETLAAGTRQVTHTYAEAGSYEPRILQPANVTLFDARGDELQWEIYSKDLLSPMTSLCHLRLDSGLNAIGILDTSDIVSILDNTFYISKQLEMDVVIRSKDMVGWNPGYFQIYAMSDAQVAIDFSDLVSWNKLRVMVLNNINLEISLYSGAFDKFVRLEHLELQHLSLTSNQVDFILANVYKAASLREHGGGGIYLLRGNASPSGTYQPCQTSEVTPDTPGKEIAYELLHDTLGVGFNKWDTVTFND